MVKHHWSRKKRIARDQQTERLGKLCGFTHGFFHLPGARDTQRCVWTLCSQGFLQRYPNSRGFSWRQEWEIHYLLVISVRIRFKIHFFGGSCSQSKIGWKKSTPSTAKRLNPSTICRLEEKCRLWDDFRSSNLGNHQLLMILGGYTKTIVVKTLRIMSFPRDRCFCYHETICIRPYDKTI